MKLCSFILSASIILNSFCICAEKKESFSKTDYQLYCFIRSAINTIQKTASKYNLNIAIDHKTCRKLSHLKSAPMSAPVLEFSNEIPTALWTPWGEWEFNRGTVTFHPIDCKGLLKDLVAAFKLKLYLPHGRYLGMLRGPAYAITTIDGQSLPIVTPAYEKPTVSELVPEGPEEIKASHLWQEMTALYNTEHDATNRKLASKQQASSEKKS